MGSFKTGEVVITKKHRAKKNNNKTIKKINTDESIQVESGSAKPENSGLRPIGRQEHKTLYIELGRIINIKQASATIKTTNGIYERGITELCLLSFDDTTPKECFKNESWNPPCFD